MSKVVSFPGGADRQAGARALILAQTLKTVSMAEGKLQTWAILELVRLQTGTPPEEEVGPAMLDALFLLTHHALLDCNTYNADQGTITFTSETWFRAAPLLTGFVSPDTGHAAPGGDAA